MTATGPSSCEPTGSSSPSVPAGDDAVVFVGPCHPPAERKAEWPAAGATLVRHRIADGRVQLVWACRCGARSAPVARAEAERQAGDLDDLPLVEGERAVYAPCVVVGCEADGYHRHHFAPRNVFGQEAEDWPTAPLCVYHHNKWHASMDGYRWRAPAVAR
jgi:hypothetical protein